MAPAAVRTGEQRVLATKSHRSHGTLDRVGGQLHAAIGKEQDRSAPVVKRITDRLGLETSRQV